MRMREKFALSAISKTIFSIDAASEIAKIGSFVWFLPNFFKENAVGRLSVWWDVEGKKRRLSSYSA